ncbi:protein PAT1 homolog 2 isoform X2 [Hemicordylus capensis]|uniref:protein PAT1 homolog 2 isoform X2 n=1 Tax=Hemicordylus capensis TaxID=884348 RepID=UPI002302ACAC|nr:protein PAT1 homolog 2 isoform X2 [Hemicordylus capensis]
MAEGGGATVGAEAQDLILEDYFMTEEEPQVEKTAEEDEIDLYVNLTFTSAGYLEDNAAKAVATKPEEAPTREPEDAIAVEEEGQSKAGEEQPMLEDVAEDESSHSESQLAYEDMEEEDEDEEEAAAAVEAEDMAGQEEENNHASEEAEEQNELGDPAVMRAVLGQPTLEREDSAVLQSKVSNILADYAADYLAASKSGMWNSTVRRVQSLSMMEALDRATTMSRVNLDFLTSPLQMSYLDSSGLERSAFRGRTLKPSSQRFIRQSPMMPGSLRSPYPFTTPRRTRRGFGLNQTSASPPPFRPFFQNVSCPTWSLTRSPDPLVFSPPTGGQQKFSLPSAMTQLHPLHQRILTQRQQRGQERSISCLELQPSEVDPYAALMTSVEKDWVIKVQMLQLQSENPHRDDYYYQEYYRKLERKQAEKGLLGGCKNEVPKLVTPYIQKVEIYESVVRIPGSLGQVAVSTCYSPRRAIDAVHHIPLEQASGNQRLQVLYQIEKMYLQLLDMEDTRRKLDLAPEEQHSHFCKKLAHEVEQLYQTLRIEEHNSEEEAKDEFLQILLVGKGKRLIARLLPHLSQEQAKQVLFTIAQHLPSLIKRDMLDETLPILYSPLSDVVEYLTFSEMIGILQELTRLQPDSVKQSLALIFGNKFAISLLYLLLSHGERCLSSGMPLKPHSGDFEKWADTVVLVARELSQVPKTSMVEPLYLPSNLLFLFCRYVDKETVNRLDGKME